MKYLVIGAGGTGGAIAGYLAKGNNDVTVIARGRHKEEIQKNGLSLATTDMGSFTVNVNCCEMNEYSGNPDAVFICVKYYSLNECIPFLQRITNSETVVIPLLNVFGTGGEIQDYISAAVLDGCIYIYSMIDKYGCIKKPTDIFRVYFGYRNGQKRTGEDKVKEIEKEMQNCGIDAHFCEDIEVQSLEKFSFVSPLGAAGIYFNAVSGDFKEKGEKQDFFIKLTEEIIELGRKMGIILPDDMLDINLKLLNDMEPNGRTSMQRDIAENKQSEFKGLVDRVTVLSDRYSLDSPCYRAVSEYAAKMNINK